jgi:hypothetical protein
MLSANYTQNRSSKTKAPEASVNENWLNFRSKFELDNLEQLILNGTSVPLTELIVLNQDLLIEQIDRIQENFLVDFATAIEIVNHKQQIIFEAEAYAHSIIKSAEEKVGQILQESAIVRQAELDGARIRLKTEREREELKKTTQEEIDRLRQDAIAESHAIQTDADSYADLVLSDLQNQLQGMLAIIQNGRQQLQE